MLSTIRNLLYQSPTSGTTPRVIWGIIVELSTFKKMTTFGEDRYSHLLSTSRFILDLIIVECSACRILSSLYTTKPPQQILGISLILVALGIFFLLKFVTELCSSLWCLYVRGLTLKQWSEAQHEKSFVLKGQNFPVLDTP